MNYKVMFDGNTGDAEVVAEVMYLDDAFNLAEEGWAMAAKDLYENDIRDWRNVNKKEPDFATRSEIRKQAFEDTKNFYWIEEIE